MNDYPMLERLCESAGAIALRVPFGVEAGGERWRVATDGIMLVAVRDASAPAPEPEREPTTRIIAGWIESENGGAVVSLAALSEFAGEAEWTVLCGECDGTGTIDGCDECDGKGTRPCLCDERYEHTADCRKCHGSGKTPHECATCDGQGNVLQLSPDSIQAVEVAGVVVDRRRLARIVAVLAETASTVAIAASDQPALVICGDGFHARLMSVARMNPIARFVPPASARPEGGETSP